MGMFDAVWVPCPNCGKPMEWQTKAGACNMDSYTLETAYPELLTDIMNDARYHETCGQWVALVDPKFPPPYRPKPNLRAVKVKAPDNPETHFQGFKWWPHDREFTYADLEEPLPASSNPE